MGLLILTNRRYRKMLKSFEEFVADSLDEAKKKSDNVKMDGDADDGNPNLSDGDEDDEGKSKKAKKTKPC